MRVLVIGSGGREHALVWKLSQSKKVDKIFCAPGNPGMILESGLKVAKDLTPLVENVPIRVNELDKLLKFAIENNIDLTIVGPEIPLIAGIVDHFEKRRLSIIGPNKKAAQIEGSKVFSKKLLLKYKIPTAVFAVFDDYSYAIEFIKNKKYPLVIKADGQCAGKGVKICQSVKEASTFIRDLMRDNIFGDSGNKIIIEEYLVGQEVSFMLATDGRDFVSLLPSQDHKRVFDNDKGDNTGGMGAYAPLPFVDQKLITRIEKEIVSPVLNAMRKEGCTYKGILYPGLILTRDGPKVLEFNCRFGDPETQPLMLLLSSDLMDLFKATISQSIKNLKLKWHKGSAVCVVLTANGYPGKYGNNISISLTGAALAELRKKNIIVFHAGTKELKNGGIISSGGRVLGVTGVGKNLNDAIKKTYSVIGKRRIYFDGMHYRTDIGRKGLAKKS